jgi:hypothetical protein
MWRFIKRGWHAAHNAHTAIWLVNLFGIPSLVSLIPIGLAWEQTNSGILLAGFLLVWAAAFMCVLGYYAYRNLRNEKATAHSTVRITLGESAPHETLRDHFYSKSRTVKIGVANTSNSVALTNCKVILESISGVFSGRTPLLIKSNFSLNPGDCEYLPIAHFEEMKPPSLPPEGRAGIHVHFDINPLSDGSSYLDDTSYDLTIVATASESSPHRLRCRLWLDGGTLRLTRRDD